MRRKVLWLPYGLARRSFLCVYSTRRETLGGAKGRTKARGPWGEAAAESAESADRAKSFPVRQSAADLRLPPTSLLLLVVLMSTFLPPTLPRIGVWYMENNRMGG